jgi:hypothetical protein
VIELDQLKGLLSLPGVPRASPYERRNTRSVSRALGSLSRGLGLLEGRKVGHGKLDARNGDSLHAGPGRLDARNAGSLQAGLGMLEAANTGSLPRGLGRLDAQDPGSLPCGGGVGADVSRALGQLAGSSVLASVMRLRGSTRLSISSQT